MSKCLSELEFSNIAKGEFIKHGVVEIISYKGMWTLLGRSKKDRKMKIIYWAAAAIFGNTINFSVTGEGSIAEECEQDAKIKAEKENPLAKTITLQQVAIIA